MLCARLKSFARFIGIHLKSTLCHVGALVPVLEVETGISEESNSLPTSPEFISRRDVVHTKAGLMPKSLLLAHLLPASASNPDTGGGATGTGHAGFRG